MTDDINKLIHPDLQMRRIRNAEDRCKKANTDWGKNFWYNTFKDYVRSMIRWTILERQYTNEYILFA